MNDERDAVRTRCILRRREGRQGRLDDVELAQHCSRENVEACALTQEKGGDILAPHMGGGTQRRLEIAATPIPHRVDEPGLALQKLLYAPEIAMRLGDEFLDEARFERGFLLHRAVSPCPPGRGVSTIRVSRYECDGTEFSPHERTMKLDDATMQELKARYAEPHRAYHTWHHIEDMLGRFATIADRLRDREAFELAILFHDAVYDPKAGDNEEQSAAFMREQLSGCVAPAVLDAAETLIMATKTHQPGAHADAAFLIDIDLSILGAEQAIFDVYDAAIRKEYA